MADTKYTVLETEAIQKMCGLIRESHSVSEGISDESLATNSTWSSVKIDSEIKNITPTIVEDENNDDETYKLNITTKDGVITTPNLKGEGVKFYNAITELDVTTPCTLGTVINAMGSPSEFLGSVNTSQIENIPISGTLSLKVNTIGNYDAVIRNSNTSYIGIYVGSGQFEWKEMARTDDLTNNIITSLDDLGFDSKDTSLVVIANDVCGENAMFIEFGGNHCKFKDKPTNASEHGVLLYKPCDNVDQYDEHDYSLVVWFDISSSKQYIGTFYYDTGELAWKNELALTNKVLSLDGGSLKSGARINIPSSENGVGALIDGSYITIDNASANKSSTITSDYIDAPEVTTKKITMDNGTITMPSTGLNSNVTIKDDYLYASLYADGLYMEDRDENTSTHVGAGGISTPSLTVGGKDVATTDVATTSSNGLMTSAMVTKLNGIAASADNVTFTRTASSGNVIGTLTINGTGTTLYAPNAIASDCSHLKNLKFSQSYINTSAANYFGIAMGTSSTMAGQYNFLFGSSLNYGLGGSSAHKQFTIGQLNSPLPGGDDRTEMTSLQVLGSATAFVIGNGYYSAGNSGAQTSNAFRIDYEGRAYGKEFLSSGADYSELLEWKDKNANEEDRVGYFVTLDENYIKLANAGEYIVGAVSGIPSVVGNEADQWQGRYVKDDFGRIMYTEWEETDEKTGETVTRKAPIINPNYDSTTIYVNRGNRKEWDNVGMLGIVRVYDDGTCKANSYCKVTDGGIATSATVDEHGYLTPVYRVMRRISDNVIEIFFR